MMKNLLKMSAVGFLCVGAMMLARVPTSYGAVAMAGPTIKVTVTDPDGAALKDIEVKLEGTKRVASGGQGPTTPDNKPPARPHAAGLGQTADDAKTTDKDGKVEFTETKPGKYRLYIAAQQGFKIATRPLKIEAGKDQTLTIKLIKDS